MAYTALLVSEQRMKQWTTLDNNVRIDEITPVILQAQDLYIQPLVGGKLYTRLKDGIVNNNLNADETILVQEYIGPTIMQYGLYLILPQLKYKIVEKGIVSGISEETQATTLDELKYLRQDALDKAEFYAKRLVEFFCANPSMFPEYLNATTKDGMPSMKDNPYFSGLVTNINKGYDKTCKGDCKGDCDCSYTIY